MKYVSKYTKFTALECPYTNNIFYKKGNRTIAIVHIDSDWNMWGEVLDPFNLPISPIKPVFGQLNQIQCEEMLLYGTPPASRIDLIEKYNMRKQFDYAKFMYCTRLITMTNDYWLAWSDNDKAEDYHPWFNPHILAERTKHCLRIEPEDEDIDTPYHNINDDTSAMNYIDVEKLKEKTKEWEFCGLDDRTDIFIHDYKKEREKLLKEL